jgi:hypothetical protein
MKNNLSMGSRIMHYCISSLLDKELEILDKNLFFLGGIAPDVNKNMGVPKARSHFFKQLNNGLISVDYVTFYKKYLTHKKSDFHLGYYFHLISDQIWIDDIYYKLIKWLPIDEKNEAQKKYYRDFWRLNGKLIDYYNLPRKEFSIEPVLIEEIDNAYLPDLINELNNDFDQMNHAKHEDLEVLKFDVVTGVLEKSVETCLKEYSRKA